MQTRKLSSKLAVLSSQFAVNGHQALPRNIAEINHGASGTSDKILVDYPAAILNFERSENWGEDRTSALPRLRSPRDSTWRTDYQTRMDGSNCSSYLRLRLFVLIFQV